MLNQALSTNLSVNHAANNNVKKPGPPCTLPFIILLCLFISLIFLFNTNHLVNKLLINANPRAPALISDSNPPIKVIIDADHPIKRHAMGTDANRLISDANRVISDAAHGIRGEHYDEITKMESLWTMRGLLRGTTPPPGKETISAPHD